MPVTVLPDDQVENISRPLANFIKSGATVALVVPAKVALGTAKLGAKAVKGVIKPAVSPTKQFASSLLSPQRAISEGFGDVPILNEITALFTGLASSFAGAGASAAKSLGGKIKSKISGFRKPKVGVGSSLSDGITGNEVPDETRLKQIGDDVEKIRIMGEKDVKKEKKDEKLERKADGFARFLGIEEDIETRRRRAKDARRAIQLAKISRKTGFAADRGALLDIMGGAKLELGRRVVGGIGAGLGISTFLTAIRKFIGLVFLWPFRLLMGKSLWGGGAVGKITKEALAKGMAKGLSATDAAAAAARKAKFKVNLTRLGAGILTVALGGLFGWLKKDEWDKPGWAAAVGGIFGGTGEAGSKINTALQSLTLGFVGFKAGAMFGPIGAVAGTLIGLGLGAALGWMGGEAVAAKALEIKGELEDMWASFTTQLIHLVRSMLPDFLAGRFTAQQAWEKEGRDPNEKEITDMAAVIAVGRGVRTVAELEEIEEELRQKWAIYAKSPHEISARTTGALGNASDWVLSRGGPMWGQPEGFDYRTASALELGLNASMGEVWERLQFGLGGDPVSAHTERNIARQEQRNKWESAQLQRANMSAAELIEAKRKRDETEQNRLLKESQSMFDRVFKLFSSPPGPSNIISGDTVNNITTSQNMQGTNILGFGGNNNIDTDSILASSLT